jgi:signal transduction histidine kinase
MDAHVLAAAALAALPSGVIALDQHEQITLITPAAARLLELDADQWLGQPLGDLVQAYPMLGDVGPTLTSSWFGHTSFWAQRITLPLEQRRVELHQLLLLAPDAPAIAQVYTLLGLFSHELRRPLTIIIGYSGLLLHARVDPITAGQRELLEVVHGQAQQANQHITQFLLLSSLATDQPLDAPTSVDLTELLPRLLAPLREEPRFVPPLITLDLPPDVPLVMADTALLEQLLGQLLIWLRKGSQHLTIAVQAADGLVAVTLGSDGPPLPSEHQAHCFSLERIHQLGTGLHTELHLYLAHQIAQRMGWSLTYVPPPQPGNSFRLTLPYG